MFGWFKKDVGGVYNPKARRIFKYFDGQKTIVADPMVLWKKVMDKSKDLEIDIQVATSPMMKPQQAADAENKALTKIREIFGVKSLSEGGLTEEEQAALFDGFMSYCKDVKKNSSLLVTSSISQESQSPSASSTTQPTSDSGSTVAEPSKGDLG